MLSNAKDARITFFLAVGALVGVILAGVYAENSLAAEIRSCAEDYRHEPAKIDCWHEIVRDTFAAKGTEEAFDVFERIYKKYDTFANTGCHRHAHRVGDMAYYFDYLTHKDFEQVAFPENATACGYGFYHGFFEHLIQDNPDPVFASDVCAFMGDHLLEVAPAISQTCFHGSGHGFLLARADTLVDQSQWRIRAFIDEPLRQCEALAGAGELEISECRQGVYNVLVDWMADGEYNLSYDETEPFAFCDGELSHRQRDCYYEMAQKADSVSDLDPVTLVSMAQSAPQGELQHIILSTGIAGLVQHDPNGSQDELLRACQLVEGELLRQCLGGIVGGLVEHDVTAQEYEKAISFCTREDLAPTEREMCFTNLFSSLRRFQLPTVVQNLCVKHDFSEAACKNMIQP